MHDDNHNADDVDAHADDDDDDHDPFCVCYVSCLPRSPETCNASRSLICEHRHRHRHRHRVKYFIHYDHNINFDDDDVHKRSDADGKCLW